MTTRLHTSYVPVEELCPHPDNPRRGDVGIIKESLALHGQYRPIVVQRSTGFVLAGNHTLKAARELGWAEVAVAYVDVDALQAKKILLVDNRAADKAGYDDQELLDLLMSFGSADLTGTGFNTDDLDELVRITEEMDKKATRYLDGIDEDPPPDPDGRDFFQLSYPVTGEQREVVLSTLRAARAHYKLETSVDALIRICKDWTPPWDETA